MYASLQPTYHPGSLFPSVYEIIMVIFVVINACSVL